MTEPDEFKLTREEANLLWKYLKHEHIPISEEFEGLYDVAKKLMYYVDEKQEIK